MIRTRLRRAFAAMPGRREALLCSVMWGIALSASSLAGLWRVTAWVDNHVPALAAIFFCAGLVAYLPAHFAARLVAAGREASVRFSAAFVALTGVSLMAAALGVAIRHVRYDLDWSLFGGPAFPYADILFSTTEGVVQFIALGVRLFLPFALPALLAASLWLAHRLR